MSRRSLLRYGGAAGTAAIGLTAAPAHADWNPVTAWLDRSVVAVGESMVLTVRESLLLPCTIEIQDSSGLTWVRAGGASWVARATSSGPGSVTVVTIREDGKVLLDHLSYTVTGSDAVGGTIGGPLIGMSAPADVWDERVRQVGAGLTARRIFADLGTGAGSQMSLIESAHEAGMLPVVSYKVGGDVRGAASGDVDRVAEQAAARLASFGRPTAVTVWHEPFGDMTGAEYVAMSRRLLPIFRRDEVKVGPVLNGWLLDNQVDTFESFCPDSALELWDWFGIDTYESGTMENPGERKPAERIVALSRYLAARGIDLPIGVGEYNGYSAATIADAGEALLSTPNVWFGCVWNSTERKGVSLSGDRLAAFRATVADPRAADSVLALP